MEKCYHCGAETQLYVYGVPICLRCAAALQGKNPPARKEPDVLPTEAFVAINPIAI